MVLPLLAGLLPMAAQMIGGMFGGGGGDKSSAGDAPKGGGGGSDLPVKMTGGELAHLLGVAKGGAGVTAPEQPILPPKQSAALEQIATQQSLQPLKTEVETTARETINRIKNDLLPQLNQIKQQQQLAANQTQATAEHRDRVAEEQFRQRVNERLERIQTLIQNHDAEVKRERAAKEARRVRRLEMLAARAPQSRGEPALPGFRW